MAHHRLHNYLRTYRRRHGFSQAEIAALLGIGSYRPVSRYEHGARHPHIFTVFALEVVFGQPASELFAGAYDTVRHAVRERARRMEQKLCALPDLDRATIRKVELLRAIVGPESKPNIAS